MAIIYTYPVKASPVDADLVLISDSADSNNTKQVKISSIRGATVSGVADVNISAVTSTLSSGAPLVSLPNSGNVIITSRAYAGAANVGHVPTGGSATTFLRGDGSWNIQSTMGSGNSYAAGLVLAGDATHGNNFLRKDGTWIVPTNTTYTAGNGLDLTGTVFSTDLKANGGLVIESTELAVNLSAISITGILATTDGGTGNTLTPTDGAVMFADSDNQFTTNTEFIYDSKKLINLTTSVTKPAAYFASSNATTAIGAYSNDIGALNIYNSNSTAGAVTLAISGEDTVNPNVSRLVTFYGASSLGPGQQRCGDIQANSSTLTVSLLNASDYRLKENIIPLTSSVSKIKLLNPISYNIIGQSTLVEGFLAHELQEQFANAVTGDKDGINIDGSINPQMVDYTKIIPVLVGAIKELTARIEALEA